MSDNPSPPDALDRTLAEMREQLGLAKVGIGYERRINRRGFLMKTSTAAAFSGAAIYIARDNDIVWPGMGPDVLTTTGQISRIELASSSRIILAPRTAVDIHHEQGTSLVRLRRGTALYEPGRSRSPFPILAKTRLRVVEALSVPFQLSVSSSFLTRLTAHLPVPLRSFSGQLVPLSPCFTAIIS